MTSQEQQLALTAKLESMSDEQLLKLFNDMQQVTFAEDSMVRQLCNEFIPGGILHLQIMELIWPLFKVMAARFEKYSKNK